MKFHTVDVQVQKAATKKARQAQGDGSRFFWGIPRSPWVNGEPINHIYDLMTWMIWGYSKKHHVLKRMTNQEVVR